MLPVNPYTLLWAMFGLTAVSSMVWLIWEAIHAPILEPVPSQAHDNACVFDEAAYNRLWEDYCTDLSLSEDREVHALDSLFGEPSEDAKLVLHALAAGQIRKAS